MKKISVIIPTLNEASCIALCLDSLALMRRRGHEVIVVDAGSTDATVSLSKTNTDSVLTTSKGRARQLNHGAEKASGEMLVFLHADTLLPENADEILNSLMTEDEVWGRFDVRLSGTKFIFRIIEFLMNQRSRLSAIATGDQAIFVSRQLFNRVGGFPEIDLMEDINICANLKKIKRPVCLKQKVRCSSRRWEKNGITKTILKMWMLRLRFALGEKPERLAREYE